MQGWTLVALGPLPAGLLGRAATFLAAATGRAAEQHSGVIDVRYAFDPRRAQYDTRQILPVLETIARERGTLVLGIADVDIFSAIFTFVFGEARLHGPAGIVSVHRLRPALYGLPEDPELLEARMRKEVLHEAGHLLGLLHCADQDCAMHVSVIAEEIDLKRDEFCEGCRAIANASAGGAGGR